MKNIVMSILVGFIVLPHQIRAQETWNPKYLFKKTFTEAGIAFSFVKGIEKADPLSAYGYFSSYQILNEKTGQTEQELQVKNSTIGDINFTHSHSTVYDQTTINEETYAAVLEADSAMLNTGFFSGIKKLNKETRLFEGIGKLKFNSAVRVIGKISDTTAVVGGDFLNITDASKTTKFLPHLAIWNFDKNIVHEIPCLSSDWNGFGGAYAGHSISKIDGTIIIRGYWAIKIFYKDIDPRTNLSDPIVPAYGGQLTSCVVAEKNRIYVVWQKDSVNYPSYLLKMRSDGTWQQVARFTNPNVSFRSDNWINSMVYDETKDLFYISGSFTKINGASCSSALIWDDKTGIFTNFPTLPFAQNQMMGSRIEVSEGKIFLIEDNDNLMLFGKQNIYVLSDITPPLVSAVTIVGGENADSVVKVSGNSEPSTFIDINIKNLTLVTEANIVINVGNSGTWSHSFGDLPDGDYQLTIKGRDASSNVSQLSSSSFTRKAKVDVVTVVNNSIETEITAYPNPASKSVFLKDAKSILKVSGIQGNTLFPNFSIIFDGIEVDVGEFQNGLYIIECENSLNKKQVLKVLVLK